MRPSFNYITIDQKLKKVYVNAMVRHFGLKKQENPPPKLLDAVTIHDACVATSERLNKLMGTHDIDVRLAGMGEDHIEGNLVNSWRCSQFYWDYHVKPFNSYTQTFFLGLFKGYNLCGMLEGGVKVTARKRIALDIQYVEGHPRPDENNLRGYIIPAFAEASLQIAKASDLSFIGVDRPSSKTVPQYKRLGYRRHFWDDFKLMKAVNGNTELKWQKLLARRQQQGFGISS